MRRGWVAVLALSVVLNTAQAADKTGVTVTLREAMAQGIGREVGTVRIEDSQYGLLVIPDLHGLSPGPHGAAVHQNPSCAPGGNATSEGAADTYTDEDQFPPAPRENTSSKTVPAGAAGGHYDPGRLTEHQGAWHHHGPYAEGHLGDLPDIMVEQDGTAKIPVLAPRARLSDFATSTGHALVIEAGVDRYQPYADNQGATPDAPVYCGIIKK